MAIVNISMRKSENYSDWGPIKVESTTDFNGTQGVEADHDMEVIFYVEKVEGALIYAKQGVHADCSPKIWSVPSTAGKNSGIFGPFPIFSGERVLFYSENGVDGVKAVVPRVYIDKRR